MNRIVLLIFLSLSFNSWSQDLKKEKRQLDYYEKSNKYLSESDLEKARLTLYFSYQANPESELGKTALKKSDSLKAVIRNELIQKIQGNWKWKNTGTNWGIEKTAEENNIEKIVEIKGLQLSFYEIDKNEKKLIQSEIIEFINEEKMIPSSTDILYSDNQIWRFDLKDDNQILKMVNSGENNTNGRTVIVCGNEELTFERIK
ncbi:hypothetical protein [Olleya sp. R77988]|uniref:hypothetical protein n=1 Tax=Olleya sp. R77988 TaxID=3093875 RepID=UPI0037CAE12F